MLRAKWTRCQNSCDIYQKTYDYGENELFSKQIEFIYL